MSRAAIALDRAAALVVAVILIAVGAGAIVWWLDLLTWLPAALDTSVVRDGTHQPWWPWAAGGAGLIAVVAGLRWMIAHLPDRGVGDLMLTGSGPDGALRAASGPVAHAAAQALAAAPGVRSATGRVLRERGQLVARLTGTVEASADLRIIAAAADQVAADLRAVLGRDDLYCQVRLTVGRRAHALPRVT